MKKSFLKSVKTFLLIVVSISFLPSCKQKNVTPKNEDIREFIPINTNNWWINVLGSGAITKRVYSGHDTLIDGATYNYFLRIDTTNNTTENEYYAKLDGYYYSLLKIDSSGNTLVRTKILNADPKVGDTWVNEGNVDYGSLTLTVKVVGTVIATNDTMTVDGVLLNDIVQVESQVALKIPFSNYADCGTVNMSFKKGIGIVKESYDIHAGIAGSQTYHSTLLDYHVAQ